jgi:hypothetical protein
MDTVLVISITAMDISSGNELYDFYLQGSDSSTMASAIHILGHLQVGHSSVLEGTASPISSVIGRYEVPFQNVVAGSILLDYARMRLVAAGTTPSITFDAWIAPVS